MFVFEIAVCISKRLSKTHPLSPITVLCISALPGSALGRLLLPPRTRPSQVNIP